MRAPPLSWRWLLSPAVAQQLDPLRLSFARVLHHLRGWVHLQRACPGVEGGFDRRGGPSSLNSVRNRRPGKSPLVSPPIFVRSSDLVFEALIDGFRFHGF